MSEDGVDFGDFDGDDCGDWVDGWLAPHDEATKHQANRQGTHEVFVSFECFLLFLLFFA